MNYSSPTDYVVKQCIMQLHSLSLNLIFHNEETRRALVLYKQERNIILLSSFQITRDSASLLSNNKTSCANYPLITIRTKSS